MGTDAVMRRRWLFLSIALALGFIGGLSARYSCSLRLG